MTQSERIIQYMKDWGSITSLEAVQDLGCMRLASRIHDIEKMGIRVDRETVRSTNRYGEPTRYTRYSLGKDAE